MPRTTLQLGPGIESGLPSDWRDATDQDTVRIQSGLHEILTGTGCCCNGTTLAIVSVGVTINQRIRAMAVSRQVDLNIREIAGSRGVDVAVASNAEITAASSAEEINSFISLATIISQETIERLVSNAEMGVIQGEELNKSRKVRDPEWGKDLSQFIRRATPHMVQVGSTEAGVTVMGEVAIDLLTLVAEVDDNGEVCCWMYEEPVVAP